MASFEYSNFSRKLYAQKWQWAVGSSSLTSRAFYHYYLEEERKKKQMRLFNLVKKENASTRRAWKCELRAYKIKFA